MKSDLFWLGLTAAMTGLFWIPYILSRATRKGFPAAFQTPKMGEAPVEAEWALRAKRAHGNAVENLVVFAPLVLTAHAMNVNDGNTTLAAQIYFWARLGHYIVLALGVPYLRTLLWTVGWLAMMAIGWQILMH